MYNRDMVRRLTLPIVVLFLLAACESREVEKDLKIVAVRTGWYDAGVMAGGQNKLVPSISLRLQNVSDRDIASVQLNAVFKRLGEDQAWGEHFIRAIDTEGLKAAETAAPVVLRSTLGYTGSQSRIQMLQNRDFVDGRVEIFGKHGSRTWVKMGEYQIDRQLLTE
jgi:hypothetical protein